MPLLSLPPHPWCSMRSSRRPHGVLTESERVISRGIWMTRERTRPGLEAGACSGTARRGVRVAVLLGEWALDTHVYPLPVLVWQLHPLRLHRLLAFDWFARSPPCACVLAWRLFAVPILGDARLLCLLALLACSARLLHAQSVPPERRWHGRWARLG